MGTLALLGRAGRPDPPLRARLQAHVIGIIPPGHRKKTSEPSLPPVQRALSVGLATNGVIQAFFAYHGNRQRVGREPVSPITARDSGEWLARFQCVHGIGPTVLVQTYTMNLPHAAGGLPTMLGECLGHASPC
jgi:hypothetical protein